MIPTRRIQCRKERKESANLLGRCPGLIFFHSVFFLQSDLCNSNLSSPSQGTNSRYWRLQLLYLILKPKLEELRERGCVSISIPFVYVLLSSLYRAKVTKRSKDSSTLNVGSRYLHDTCCAQVFPCSLCCMWVRWICSQTNLLTTREMTENTRAMKLPRSWQP